MENHPKKEQTFVLLKPDAIQRSLMGEILSRFERSGLKFSAFKFIVPTEEQCWEHYKKDDEWYQSKGERIIEDRKKMNLPVEKEAFEYGKDIITTVVNYVTSGPALALVIEGNKSVDVVTKLVGGTEPTTSDVGTIRGDFTLDSFDAASLDERAVRNLVHCSESPEEAQREIAIWFNEDEIISYTHLQEKILYDVNLDGILE